MFGMFLFPQLLFVRPVLSEEVVSCLCAAITAAPVSILLLKLVSMCRGFCSCASQARQLLQQGVASSGVCGSHPLNLKPCRKASSPSTRPTVQVLRLAWNRCDHSRLCAILASTSSLTCLSPPPTGASPDVTRLPSQRPILLHCSAGETVNQYSESKWERMCAAILEQGQNQKKCSTHVVYTATMCCLILMRDDVTSNCVCSMPERSGAVVSERVRRWWWRGGRGGGGPPQGTFRVYLPNAESQTELGFKS